MAPDAIDATKRQWRPHHHAIDVISTPRLHLEQAVEPRQPVAHAVVRVEDHRHAVELRELAHLERARDAAGHRGLVGLLVPDELAREELAAAAGELDDHGAAVLGGRLHARIDAARAHGVDGGNREALLLGVGEEIHQSLAGHDAGLDRRRQRDGRGLERRRAGRGPRGRDERRRAGEGEGDDDGLHLCGSLRGVCVSAAVLVAATVSSRRSHHFCGDARALAAKLCLGRVRGAVLAMPGNCAANRARAHDCNQRGCDGVATGPWRVAQPRIFG